jgi:hypothetical protein
MRMTLPRSSDCLARWRNDLHSYLHDTYWPIASAHGNGNTLKRHQLAAISDKTPIGMELQVIPMLIQCYWQKSVWLHS